VERRGYVCRFNGLVLTIDDNNVILVLYFFFLLGARWLNAEPAAVFDVLLVRPSRSTFDAALAAFALVFRFLATNSPPS
jgi:hypothetical protein